MRRPPRSLCVLSLTTTLALFWPAPAPAAPPPPLTPEASRAFDLQILDRAEQAVSSAVANRLIPGAVILVGRSGQVHYAKSFGYRALAPAAEPMTQDSIFDLASLTKPVATATAVMMLVERGRLRLEDRLGGLLPEFDNHGKGEITIEQLLRHRSGLIADNPLSDYADGPEKAWERLANLDLAHPAGQRFLYSDVNFIILGKLVEKLSGMPLDRFWATEIASPLGLSSTRFLPLDEQANLEKSFLERIVPTEPDEQGLMLRGRVHDPRSRALGGVAGHAGLFGTAEDLGTFLMALLSGGIAPNGHRLLQEDTVKALLGPGQTPPGERRALGWDLDTPYSSPRGSLFGAGSFGHTGFTGTSLWADPQTGTFVVLLASRLHPDGKGSTPSSLRRTVGTAVAQAALQAPSSPPVLTGVDVLIKRQFLPLKGKRVALVTNHTGRTSDGRSTIDALFTAPEVKLVALFSPEHGLRGLLDKPVADDRDEATGLPVFSLYGASRKPAPENLENVDALVYDIQDIGARFYTYISTLGLCLEAAKERGIPLVVLDRPNPIGGVEVQGPVRDPQFESFIAHHALPVRHGMTVGELAALFNQERAIGAELLVIPCENWRRAQTYDATGLLWINPSPNMRSLTEAILYPGVGFLEATNLATGRGTDTPFERVGAPWIDPQAWAADLNARHLPGVRFLPIRFTPRERQYSGQECGGVFIMPTEILAIDPIDLGLSLALSLRSLYPDQWKPEALLKMLGDQAAYDALLQGRSLEELHAIWKNELDEFLRLRRGFLIYD